MRLKSKQGGGRYMISHSKTKKPANFRLRVFVFFGSPTWTLNRYLRIKSVDGCKNTLSNKKVIANQKERVTKHAFPRAAGSSLRSLA
jgi:hypothetical protein